MGVSIGITIYPDDSMVVDDLIKQADLAMYKARQEGKNNLQYFSAAMNDAARERLKMEDKLRKAVERQMLELYYQPQVEAKTGKISGLEALIRWSDPEEGWISPEVFIPIVEEMGLIVPIGEWVLFKACKQAALWKAQESFCVPISVAALAGQRLGDGPTHAARAAGDQRSLAFEFEVHGRVDLYLPVIQAERVWARYSPGESPVQRRKAREKADCSEYPSRSLSSTRLKSLPCSCEIATRHLARSTILL